eukprot:PITA_32778
MEGKLLEREHQEEVLWRQKSRIRWLKEGEKNTKFFHRTIVQRRMHNHIAQVTNAQGEKLETQEEIEKEFLHYFKEMSKEPNTNRGEAIDDIIRHIPQLVSEEQNSLLLKPISLQEVELAEKSLKAGKAPGPDGFSSNFFHHFWDLIKWEVWQVVEESRSLCWMYPGLNATFIALIPKSEDSNSPDKFRPIALCNIIYKIVSKVVALRLKPLLPGIISPEQSGYVEGRQITDGIILTHEIIHSLKHSKKPEGLGRSLKAAIQSLNLKGINLHDAPTVSHQQFVDDNMIFGHSSVQEARSLNSLLNTFSAASGACINRVKS